MVDRSEQLITVFGGGGFIGRSVCEILLRSGVRVRVAQRNPRQAYTVQTSGQVGQIGYVAADITDVAGVHRAVDGADGAINLCGVFGAQMQAVHVNGARNLAQALSEAGAASLVHLSAIGADPASASAYGRTKAEGEAAVRAAFPAATIIRPSLVFGADDQLTNRFAAMAQLPFLPVLAAGRRFQPVFVGDLAQAIVKAALDPGSFGGQSFALGGPQVMTMVELHQAILDLTGQRPDIVALPDVAGNLLSYLGFLPGAPLTRDQWLMLQHDNVAGGGLPGLDAFGIAPTPMAAVAGEWLGRYRKGGRHSAQRKIHLTATD